VCACTPEKHYVCDKGEHECCDDDCENYVCVGGALYGRLRLCLEHDIPVTKRIINRVVECARKSKRTREDLTEAMWSKKI
jgi:hypothetical protein